VSELLAGVFVGGRGTRMGGQPKGLLEAPGGGTLVERLRRVLAEVGAEIVLVGTSDAYASLGFGSVADEPSGVGPLGGLAGLLRRAGERPALAVACDMPYVGAALLGRLAAAPPAPVVAPRREGRWEPLCARYEPAAVLPVIQRMLAAHRHSLQAVLDESHAVALELSPEEALELRDWDAPADIF
jgi:molybdopterin-guanine dinucleotide biosynthesis protein A